MDRSQSHSVPAPDAESSISLAAVLAPVLERWRILLSCVVILTVLQLAWRLSSPRSFEASITVATVGSSAPSINLGGAASLLSGGLGSFSSGLQANPALVQALMKSRRVLFAVGTRREPNGKLLVETVAGRTVAPEAVAGRMAAALNTDINPQTGLVLLRYSSADSGAARKSVNAIIEETSKAFTAIARAQAFQLRLAQEARLDSASRRLTRVEEELAAFGSANRSFQPFSRQALQRQALERSHRVAQEVYMKAVADREAAVAKELEATPALVVVDPLPDRLPTKPRHLVLITVLTACAGVLLGLLVVFMLEALDRDSRRRDPDVERLRRAVSSIPLLRRREGAESASR